MIKNLKSDRNTKTFIDVERDRRSYIKKLLAVYELLHPVEEFRLIKSERDFLAECILLDSMGIDIGSTEARIHLEEFFNLKKRSVYTLRRDLKNKGWLRQDDYGYHFPAGLDKTEFRLELIFEKHGDDRGQNNKG